MKICGIDYSMTSPAMCIHEGDSWSYSNCQFYYMVKNDKKLYSKGPFHGSVYPKYESDQERYLNLSNWAIANISGVDSVAIEGYAFGAVGRVFQIAENTGQLKQTLWESKIPFVTYTPGEIKKLGSGKGNSDKAAMVDAFYKETGVDLWDTLSLKNRNHWNPVSDIVDAYYIAKLHFSRLNEIPANP